MNARIARLLPIALLLGLASCFDDTVATVDLPVFTGNRVIYIADTDGDDASISGDEVFVADTGSVSQTVTRMGNAGAPAYFDLPDAIGTSGAFVVRLVSDPTDGCPSNYRLVPRAGGPVESIFGGECVYAYASNAAASRFVFIAKVGTTGTNLYVFDPADPAIVEQINVGNTGFPGTVSEMALSANGATLFWEDATGVAAADLTETLAQIRFSASLLVPGDQPTGLFPLADGTGVIYAHSGEEKFKLVLINNLGVFDLTNLLGGGDLLDRTADSVRLSSNGATLLYVATIGGVKQLLGLRVNSPFTEARADSAITQLLQSGYSFEFSPDGLSYAWLGDDGTGNTVFSATVNAPTNILTLTPVGEEPTGPIRWTDGATIAYISSDADLVTPVGASALRIVNTGSPLNTYTVSPNESQGYFVGTVDTCSDGTLVYDLRFDGLVGSTTALYTADPQSANSGFRISPEIVAPSDEIFAISCVD